MRCLSIVAALSTLLFASICSAQQVSTTAVPNFIRFSGTLKDGQGEVLSSATVGVRVGRIGERGIEWRKQLE